MKEQKQIQVKAVIIQLKNVNILSILQNATTKTFKTIILPLVLYGRETWQ